MLALSTMPPLVESTESIKFAATAAVSCRSVEEPLLLLPLDPLGILEPLLPVTLAAAVAG